MYVGVTLHYFPDGSHDLDLPASLKAAEAARLLGDYFFPASTSSSMAKFILKHQEAERVLQGGTTLGESMIVDGDHLLLLSKIIPRGFLTTDSYFRTSGPALAAGNIVFPIERRSVVIGRQGYRQEFAVPLKTLDISRINPNESAILSRRHALIFRDRDGFFLQDLGSLNGTCLNGAPLMPMERYRLHHGDLIRFGRYELVFLWDYQEDNRTR